MDVSDPISTPESDRDQPQPDDSYSLPPDGSDGVDDPPVAPLPPVLADEFHAILDLKEVEGDAARVGEDVCVDGDGGGGGVNGVSEIKEEEKSDGGGGGIGKAAVAEDETGGGGEKEVKEEVVKDGWSEGVVENGNKCGDDGWNDGYGGEEPEWKDEKERRDMQAQYPLRPGAEDCNFYMRMGSCKFGSSCKFNHPPRRSSQTVKPRMKEREDGSDRPNQMECKYYMSAAGCKYGKACRFNHSRERPNVVPVLEYNFMGLPIRPGEKECPYYMRNGSCKYAANCRFNHPEPTGGSDAPPGYAKDEQAISWPCPRPSNEAAPFLTVSFSSAQGVHSQISEWNGYLGPVFAPEKSFRPSAAFGSNIPSMAKSAYPHLLPQLAIEEFPERPGQPECTYFLKTGDCKFRSGCKFHHPKDRIVQPSCAVTDKGLPLRPGQSICTHYRHYGICKFGPKCRYDHPPNIQNTAPSAITGLHQPHHPFSNFASPAEVASLSSMGEATITQ